MKKLLLVSIIMISVSGLASAQTPESFKSKKEANKKDNNAPALVNASQEVVPAVATTAKVAVKEKTDYEKSKEVELKKSKAVAPAKVVAPAKKAKSN